MQYRRSKTPGTTYFFTVVTHQRQVIFSNPETVELLRQSFRKVKQAHPFILEAMVVLPEHLHCIWTLPENDADFSLRWRLIKSHFSRGWGDRSTQQQTPSRLHKGEQPVWQRRFWEHRIRDEQDFANHVDYIHFNPVKHGLVRAPRDWPYSSFGRYMRDGCYPADWGAAGDVKLPDGVGNE
ncbi:MAG: transposase [Cyanobacteria bacterium P01_G01_bin.54]